MVTRHLKTFVAGSYPLQYHPFPFFNIVKSFLICCNLETWSYVNKYSFLNMYLKYVCKNMYLKIWLNDKKYKNISKRWPFNHKSTKYIQKMIWIFIIWQPIIIIENVSQIYFKLYFVIYQFLILFSDLFFKSFFKIVTLFSFLWDLQFPKLLI